MSYKDHIPTITESTRRKDKQNKAVQHSSFIAAPPSLTESLTDNGIHLTPQSETQNILLPFQQDIENLSENIKETIDIALDAITAGFHRIQLPDASTTTINFKNLTKNKAENFILDITKKNTNSTPTVTFDPPINGLTQADLDGKDRICVQVVARDTEDEVRYDVLGSLGPGGGGGEFVGPWTANHDAGGFTLLNLIGIKFKKNTSNQLRITAVDSGTPDGTFDRLEYDADNLGAHDFYVDRKNTTIPRFGITENSIESNVDLNMHTYDINNLDRLKFSISSGATANKTDTVIYQTVAGDLVFNNNEVDKFLFALSDDTIMQLDQTGTADHRTLTIGSDNTNTNSASFLRIAKRHATPVATQVIGELGFYGTRTANAGIIEYGAIGAQYQKIAVGTHSGSLYFDITRAGAVKRYMDLNDADTGQIKFSVDLDMNEYDISDVDRLQFVKSSGTVGGVNVPQIYISSVDDEMVFNNSANDFVWSHSNLITMKETPNSLTKSWGTAPFFNLVNTRDYAVGLTAAMTFSARVQQTTVGVVSMAGIQAETEVVTSNGSGSMSFYARIAGTGTTFIHLNDGNLGLIDFHKDLDMNNNIIGEIKTLELKATTDPSSPTTGDTFLYSKLDGTIAKLYYKQSDGTVVGPLGTGGSGSSNKIEQGNSAVTVTDTGVGVVDVMIDGPTSKFRFSSSNFSPIFGGAVNLGTRTIPWGQLIVRDIELDEGGTLTTNAHNIVATSTGIIYNTKANDIHRFQINGETNFIIEEDEIKFRVGRAHSIRANGSELQIVSEREADAVEIWNGTGRTNANVIFNNTTTTFLTETDNIGELRMQFIQNHNTPADFRTIANLDFLAENSNSINEIYARISVSSQDVTNGTEDGLLQLGVVSAGTLVSGMDIEGGTSNANGAKIGFYGKTPTARQTVAVSTLAIHTALKNLGLFA